MKYKHDRKLLGNIVLVEKISRIIISKSVPMVFTELGNRAPITYTDPQNMQAARHAYPFPLVLTTGNIMSRSFMQYQRHSI
jgi:hypothetical protein